MKTKNETRPFGIRDSIAYAAGDLGCNMSFALKGTMALFWTQVMGMSAWYSLLLVIVARGGARSKGGAFQRRLSAFPHRTTGDW